MADRPDIDQGGSDDPGEILDTKVQGPLLGDNAARLASDVPGEARAAAEGAVADRPDIDRLAADIRDGLNCGPPARDGHEEDTLDIANDALDELVALARGGLIPHEGDEKPSDAMPPAGHKDWREASEWWERRCSYWSSYWRERAEAAEADRDELRERLDDSRRRALLHLEQRDRLAGLNRQLTDDFNAMLIAESRARADRDRRADALTHRSKVWHAEYHSGPWESCRAPSCSDDRAALSAAARETPA
jgi:hypothetical protein